MTNLPAKPAWSEKVWLCLLGAAFLLPLAFTLLVQAEAARGGSSVSFLHRWLRNDSLAGVTVPAPAVPFSWKTLASGEYQKSKASWFNERFAGREALIRVTNEVWFRLFRETGSATSPIAIGVNDALFEKLYLREYFLQRAEKESLAPWVKDLRRLQDICRSRGMGFVVLLTPSKVTLAPDDTPPRWRRWYDPRPRGSAQLVELFLENDIAFVNATALLAAGQETHRPAAPFFPKGGVHWSSRAAWFAANAMHSMLRAQGQPLLPLEVAESQVTDIPEGEPADLLALMNLVTPWRYPIEKLTIRPGASSASEQLTMAMVGGSFCWELLRQLSASRQYSAIDFYLYYKLQTTRVAEGRFTEARPAGMGLDFSDEIFAADCLVLEINEASAFHSSHYLSAFLADALR